MSFIRQFFIYGLSGAASRLAAVVLVPLYTRTLSITDYGRLELLLALHALVVILSGLQTESSIAREFFEQDEDQCEARKRSWWALTLSTLGSAVISVVAVAIWNVAGMSSELNGVQLVLLLALTLPAQLLGVQLVMLRFQGSAMRFALVSFADLTSCALFSALYIVTLGWGLDGALLGILSGKLVCVMLAWARTFGRPPQGGLTWSTAKKMLDYGVPSIPAVLIGWIQNAGNRLLLAVALTLNEVAVAGIAIKVAAIYGFVVYSYRLAWEPFSMAKLNGIDDDPHIFNRALQWYVLLMFSACGVAILLSPFVARVLAPPIYVASGWLAAFFLLGQFWAGATNVLAIGIHRARRTGLLLPVFGLGALVNLALLFSLSRLVGIAAAGIGFMVGSIVSAYAACHYSNRHLSVPFSAPLLHWTLLATTVSAGAWYGLWLRVQDQASGTPLPSPLIVVIGMAGVASLVAMVVWRSFEPGRATAMWGSLLVALRTTVMR